MLQDAAELVIPWVWDKLTGKKGKDDDTKKKNKNKDDDTSTTSDESISVYSDTLLADGMTFGK